MPGGIKREVHADEEILVIDFADCKEDGMIALMIELRDILIAGNRPLSILGVFTDKNFLTPRFMQAFRKEKRLEAAPFIKKQAVVGLNETKKIILKGFNLFYKRNIRSFDSVESAIEYLISDKP